MSTKGLEVKSEKLDLHLSGSAKNLLKMAATASDRKLTESVRESAIDCAKSVLPECQVFGLDADCWQAFQSALDAPPRDLLQLVELLREPSVFEKGF